MPITYKQKVAQLSGHCEIELAEELDQWLAEKPARQLNLKALTSVHTAVFQVIALRQPKISVWPKAESLNWLQDTLVTLQREDVA